MMQIVLVTITNRYKIANYIRAQSLIIVKYINEDNEI